MGVDTLIYLPDVTKKSIENFLAHIAENVKLEDSRVDEDYKIIRFEYKGEQRQLHCHRRYLKKEDYIKNYMKRYDKDREEIEKWWNVDELESIRRSKLPINTNGEYCSIGFWGHNIEIMKSICHYFGGYIDESDSDSEEFYKVDKEHKKIIPLIFEE